MVLLIMMLNLDMIARSLENYDVLFVMQELGKSSLKINVIPKLLEIYMSFSINNKLKFIDSS